MEWTQETQGGSVIIRDHLNEIVAMFNINDGEGELAHGIFINGLVHYGGISLFDKNEPAYIVSNSG